MSKQQTSTLQINAPSIRQLETGYVKAFRYPMGEWQVVYLGPVILDVHLRIIANVHSADDLVILLLLLDALKGLGYKEDQITVCLPYLPYGRADRRFRAGDCFGKDFLVRSLKGLKIVTYDEHSSTHSEILNQSPEIEQEKSISRFVLPWCREVPLTVVFPDEGAKLRYKLPENLTIPVLFGTKKRDPESGAILEYSISGDITTPDVLVIDDICDGGATFLQLGAALRKQTAADLHLHVSHGIFSKGLTDLNALYRTITCTNSLRPERPGVVTYPIRWIIC